MYIYRDSKINHADVIDPSVFHSSWWTSASVVAGHEGFAADKIATDYAVGI